MIPGERLEALRAKLPPRLDRWARLFLACELAFEVPAELMAAICDRESLGGDALKPKGPTGKGDKGHGHGLGQIDGRFHHSFCVALFDDGQFLWEEPAFNLMYGARLLARNYRAAGNDWNVAIAAYNCGLLRAGRAVAGLPKGAHEDLRISALDRQTTGGDYVTDVRRRRASFTRDDTGTV